jgi:murein DD-endopeptidase MepM/ murein hydrolase activator NlpD
LIDTLSPAPGAATVRNPARWLVLGTLALAFAPRLPAQAPPKPPIIPDAAALAERAKAELRVTKPDFVVFVPKIKGDEVGDTGNEHFLVFDGPDGSLMAVWTQSSAEAQPDQHIAFARSDDEGKTWTDPRIIAGPKRAGDGHMASWGYPLVSKTGRIYVLYSQHIGKHDSFFHHTGWLHGIHSDDNGKTWSAPQNIPVARSINDNPDASFPPNMLCWQKPLRLGKDDKYLAGFTRWTSNAVRPNPVPKDWRAHDARVEFMRFENVDDAPEVKDLKISWFAANEKALAVPFPGQPGISACQEPSLVKLPDDRLFVVMRTATGSPYWSVSADGGETWAEPRKLLRRDGGAPLLHPLSPCPIYDVGGNTAGSGRYALFIHNHDGHFQGYGPTDTQFHRRPVYLVAGRFQPGADQPVWFEEPRPFMDHEGVGLGRPGTPGRQDLALYASFTVRNGTPVLWYPERKFFLLGRVIGPEWLSVEGPPAPTRTPILRAVDLDVGESQTVELADGSKATIRLVKLEERRDPIRGAVREARATVEVNGASATLVSANYRLPVEVGGVQVDCPVTGGYRDRSTIDHWGLKKAARLRLWPKGSPWIEPGTFRYPARQRWFASGTQMANEPTFVDGGDQPSNTKIYYHSGLDIGGAEGMVEVVAATDGLVVSSGKDVLPGYEKTPVNIRYDVVYLLDDRGWYYRYSHLQSIDPAIRPGGRVKMGQKVGVLGKEGGSGGWAHLHFEAVSRQPSGEWGTQEGYAFLWQAYLDEFQPDVLAVARPHRLARVGDAVALDGSRSWARSGAVARYEWTFTDGTTASGPKVTRTYERPGHYSEVLRVTDDRGHVGYDFAVVQVLDPAQPDRVPPSIQAAYAPTLSIKPGQPVTFKVRTFRTTDGRERWDFGDGTPPVEVRSDGNVVALAKDGFAVTEHRYAKPGDYLVKVERTNARGETAVAHLHVRVQGE